MASVAAKYGRLHAGSLGRPLSLPEEWVLLSRKESGKTRDPGQAVAGCTAAELGELALRRKLLVRSRKFTVLGFEAYRPYRAEILLLDTSRTGLPRADELLADLERCPASGQGRLSVMPWLRRRRRQAFTLHRNALAERGVLRRTCPREPAGYQRGTHLLGTEEVSPPGLTGRAWAGPAVVRAGLIALELFDLKRGRDAAARLPNNPEAGRRCHEHYRSLTGNGSRSCPAAGSSSGPMHGSRLTTDWCENANYWSNTLRR
ncbi:MAG: GPP34 family phosphoprotein [Trebonia sp.]